MALLIFSPGQVASVNNINQTANNTSTIEISKTFADVTINGGVKEIRVEVDDSELITNPATGELNFLEKTQGDSKTTLLTITVVMNDGTIYTRKDGSPDDFREQDTSNPASGSFTPEHGDDFVMTNSSIELVDSSNVSAPTSGAGSFDQLSGQNLIFSASTDWTVGVQTRSIDSSGDFFDASGDGLFNAGDVLICFTTGTLIATPRGEIPVEAIRAGDLVHTLDNGPQPVRWTGRRTVAAANEFAPVEFAPGAIGNASTLRLSPQHRVLLCDPKANLLFCSSEVLVPAIFLVNGRTVRRIEGGTVTYHHLLFDTHEIIWSNGARTESFQPSAAATNQLERAARREVFALFPELAAPGRRRKDRMPGSDVAFAAARPSLRRYEARALLA